MFYLAKNGNSRGRWRGIFSSENKLESARFQKLAYPDCWRGFNVQFGNLDSNIHPKVPDDLFGFNKGW